MWVVKQKWTFGWACCCWKRLKQLNIIILMYYYFIIGKYSKAEAIKWMYLLASGNRNTAISKRRNTDRSSNGNTGSCSNASLAIVAGTPPAVNNTASSSSSSMRRRSAAGVTGRWHLTSPSAQGTMEGRRTERFLYTVNAARRLQFFMCHFLSWNGYFNYRVWKDFTIWHALSCILTHW